MILGDEPLRSEGVQYATGEEQGEITNSSRKNEGAGSEQKHSVVDVSGGESKIQCYKEQYCIGTWNARSIRTWNNGLVPNWERSVSRLYTVSLLI